MPYKTGWVSVRYAPRFKKLRSSAVDRYAELAGPCIVFSACPNTDIDAVCHQLFNASVIAGGSPLGSRVTIVTTRGDRLVITAESPGETHDWLDACTRAASRHINQHYACDTVIGPAGTFARVAAARDLTTSRPVHVRHTSKASLPAPLVALARREAVNLLAVPHHRAVPQVLDVYETPSTVYVVTDVPSAVATPKCLVSIRDRVRVGRPMSERDASYIMHGLLDALLHLHMAGVIHRGCTADAVLFANPTCPDAGVKLTSFELATSAMDGPRDIVSIVDVIRHRGMDESIDSTIAAFIAPEVARGGTGTASQDSWSAGILMHYMLVGVTPFHRDGQVSTAASALATLQQAQGKPGFSGVMWDGVSREAKDLAARLLHADPLKRLLPKQALTHPWFRFNNVDEYDASSSLRR
jgi:serine/threonine protein kinase